MRLFAIIPERGFVHEIMPMLKIGKMGELLTDPSTCDIVGIPAYYDEQGRVWPKCIDGCVVVTDQLPTKGSNQLKDIKE